MRFFSVLLTGASLIGAALAQSKNVFFTEVPTSVTVGQPATIKWTAVNPNAVRGRLRPRRLRNLVALIEC